MSNANLLRDIEIKLNNFESIPENRRYWLVRTEGGEYYQTFVKNRFIALGYNKISLNAIDSFVKGSRGDRNIMIGLFKDLIKIIYGDQYTPSFVANQLVKFIVDIKKDDIVLIPSYNSSHISFGTVESNELQSEDTIDTAATECDFTKRKSVIWQQGMYREELDPFLYRVLQSHQAINEISHYADTIERTLSNFYTRGEEGNLVLNVETSERINALELFKIGYYLLQQSQAYFAYNGLPFDISDVEVKINLNSPGKIHLKAPNKRTIWLMAVLFIGINGGGVSLKSIGLDLHTDGLIKNVIEYLNSKHDREMDEIKRSIDSLKVKQPTDALKPLQTDTTK